MLAVGVVRAEASDLQAEPFNCSDLSKSAPSSLLNFNISKY